METLSFGSSPQMRVAMDSASKDKAVTQDSSDLTILPSEICLSMSTILYGKTRRGSGS